MRLSAEQQNTALMEVHKVTLVRLGGINSIASKDEILRMRVYASVLDRVYKKFQVSNIADIDKNDFEELVITIDTYQLPLMLSNDINRINFKLKEDNRCT